MTLTYFGKENPLVETIEFCPQRITESVEADVVGQALAEEAGAGSKVDRDGKRMVLEGVFQRSDVPNANKRIYPRKVWESLLAAKSPVIRRVKERAMIGHLEHPEDGSTDLNRGAILVTGLKLQEDGTVWGRLVVLNTPAGKIVQEYVDAGVKIGISSRGTGSVDSKGVVQEDFNVDTWDIVYNPSTPGAHPTMEKTNESKGGQVAEAVIVAAPDNTTPAVSEPPKGGESPKPHLTLVQQYLIAGVDAVRSHTGCAADADVAAMFQRALSWLTQHGEYKSLDEFWAAFKKVDPKCESAEAVAAPVVIEAKKADADKDKKKKDEKDSSDKPSTDGDGKTDADEVDESKRADAAAIITEAKATILALGERVTSLEETNRKVTADLETSTAITKELTERVARLQATVSERDKAVAFANRTIAALTAQDGAAQVREAVETVIRKDARLAGFRDVLESQKTPAAVEARAARLVDTLAESQQKVTESVQSTGAKPTLESRIARRVSIMEDRNLPAKRELVESTKDAVEVTAPPAPKSKPSPAASHASRAAAAIRGLHQ